MNREKLKNMLIESAKIRQLESSNKTPSVGQMARNITKTAIDTVKTVAAGNSANVSTEEAEKRKNICNSCPAYNQAQQRCTKCGCFMAVKAYLRAASCPLNKW